MMVLMKKILMKKIRYKNFFLKKYNEVSGFASSPLKYQKFFKLGTQKPHFQKYKKYKKFFSNLAEKCGVPFLEV